MKGCRGYFLMLFLGLGLALGGGVIYAVMTDESLQAVALFAAGLGAAGLPLMILLVWMLRIVSNNQAQQRVNHNYRYTIPQIAYPHYGQPADYSPQNQQQPTALGAGDDYGWKWDVVDAPLPEEEEAPIA